MQETMWSNSCRRKEGITCALWFHASVRVQGHVSTRTHTHTHAPTHGICSPLSTRSPTLLKGPDAFRPQGHDGRAVCTPWLVWGDHRCHWTCDIRVPSWYESKLSHLFPSALHDFNGNGIDLVVHFHRSLFPTADFHQQDTEICSSKIKGQEVTMLYYGQEHKRT